MGEKGRNLPKGKEMGARKDREGDGSEGRWRGREEDERREELKGRGNEIQWEKKAFWKVWFYREERCVGK